MEVQNILKHLEALFARQDIDAVEPFLTDELDSAYARKDYGCCITIMNELIGFFRDTGQYEKSLKYGGDVLKLMKQLGYEGTIPYATTLLNVANALRAAGHHNEALRFYQSIFPIYEKNLSGDDELIASLYNNLSLLYQEMNDFEQAVDCLNKAYRIIVKGKDEIKIATTHTNLAASLLKLGQTQEAVEHLHTALDIFAKTDYKDFHFNAAAAAMAQAYVAMGKPEEARTYYQVALMEQLRHCGKSENFYRILDNLHLVEKSLHTELTPEPDRAAVKDADPMILLKDRKPEKGLDVCERFFKEIGYPALQKAFGELAGRWSYGLVGEGSECFGFDDALSRDHDFGPGFIIWMEQEDFVQYAEAVQKVYDSLPDSFAGVSRKVVNGSARTGVHSLDGFFAYFTGFGRAAQVPDDRTLLTMEEEHLAALFNGRVFYDYEDRFENRRRAFARAFTDRLWNLKIGESLIRLGQLGQYNYPRTMARQDQVTAQIILYKYVEEVLKLVHYVDHAFPPYYKWLCKSAASMDTLPVLADFARALTDFSAEANRGLALGSQEDFKAAEEKIQKTVEYIAVYILDALKKKGMLEHIDIPEEETYLEVYGKTMVIEHLNDSGRKPSVLKDPVNLENNSEEELVEHIVSLEWQAFDQVQNMGGRAECQDNWSTFSIMRKSQYMTWPKELLISFIQDFRAANEKGWNLITEKYARMMETTDPAEYDRIQDSLPPVTMVTRQLIDQVAEIQVAWMEEFAKEYPHMASNSRAIHTSEDTPYQTSYETYLKGEMSTYSPATLKQYAQYIIRLARQGENLARMIMTNTALLYGYASLEQAEERLKDAEG